MRLAVASWTTILKPIRKYCEQELGMEEGECLIDGWNEAKIKKIMRQAKEDTVRAKKETKRVCLRSASWRTTWPTTRQQPKATAY